MGSFLLQILPNKATFQGLIVVDTVLIWLPPMPWKAPNSRHF